MSQMSQEALQQLIQREFPQSEVVVEKVVPCGATVRMPIGEQHLRPGGTVSGPTMMALADTAMYVAILGEIGPMLLAVTTNLNINFMHKPVANCDLLGECRLLKLGKRLAVGEVSIYSEGYPEIVAHVTSTYSIPPR
jgi:uncharacterized protein (TIGR00369 family)